MIKPKIEELDELNASIGIDLYSELMPEAQESLRKRIETLIDAFNWDITADRIISLYQKAEDSCKAPPRLTEPQKNVLSMLAASPLGFVIYSDGIMHDADIVSRWGIARIAKSTAKSLIRRGYIVPADLAIEQQLFFDQIAGRQKGMVGIWSQTWVLAKDKCYT
jgi:hypothetical protein